MLTRLPISIALATTLAVATPSQAREFGGVEVTTHLKNETAVFVRDGQRTGQATSVLDRSEDNAGDLMKFENSAKMFFNGDLGDSATWHGELNLIYDAKGVNSDYKGHRSYTQHDYLRELYVDTSAADWDLRLGKQQVVWGTADGIKLLDIINPTDFRELNQNTFEDSRIPIWMVNAERNIGERGNIQLILSQVEENKIPGLNPRSDSGHPFLMKGVDTISGRVNGFYYIAPALASTASSFNLFAAGGAFGPSPSGLVPFGGLTVDGFAASPGLPGGTGSGDSDLNMVAQGGTDFTPFTGDPYENNYVTKLLNIDGPLPTDVIWNPTNPKSAFEYMANATFATFNTFTGFDGSGTLLGSQTTWSRDYPPDANANAGFRFRNYTDAGLNYSLNYFYHHSANPDVNLSWHDANTGEELIVQRAPTGPGGVPDVSTDLSRDDALASTLAGTPVTILVNNGTDYYGGFDPRAFDGTLGLGAPTLRFTESLHRVHSLGASFDYALDTDIAPFVLRGEFLYDRDDRQPVVDRYLLSIGDLTNALRMEEADYFKYVLGVDVTVMTNLLVSGQFIQFRNLDFVNQSASCVTQAGNTVDCSKYTGDLATLSLSNGMNKAYKNKEFYSLFFSKPFGEAQLGRWNNITIYEEGGGWWNRFDVEYSFSDQLLVTGELNLYFGDEDTTFGQFENSSNLQVGMKYIFD